LFDEVGPETADALSVDIYALGVILWELWFRSVPFAGVAFQRIVMRVTKGKRLLFDDATAAGGRGSGDVAVPPALRHLIEACWAQRPNDRPRAAAVTRAFAEAFAPSSALFQQMQQSLDKRARSAAGSAAGAATTVGAPGGQTARMSAMAPLGEDDLPDFVETVSITPQAMTLGRTVAATTATTAGASTLSRGHRVARLPRRAATGDIKDGTPGAATASPPAQLPPQSLREFLAKLSLSHYLEKLEALGFTEVETLSDRELLDDDTLLKEVGLTRPEVKRLRVRIEAQGTGPTLVSRRAAAREGHGTKI
jgi:hypothetical protein